MKRNKEQQEVSAAWIEWCKEKPNQRKWQTQQEMHEEIRQKHTAERNKTNLLRQKRRENERRQKQKIVEQSHKGRSTTNMYLANTREVGHN